MLEFTTSQIEEMGTLTGEPLRITNPQTNESYVLLRDEEYKRLTVEEDEIDYSPWTPGEMHALMWHNLEQSGQLEEWSGYDDPLEDS